MSDTTNLAELAIVLGAALLAFREIGKVLIAKSKVALKATPKVEVSNSKIADQLPESGYALLQSMEIGLDKFGNDMATHLREKGVVDPMTDEGYKHLVERLAQVRSWRTSYESNPLLQMGDKIAWPIVKRLPDRAIQLIEGMVS